jgi:hypothetical protein
VKTTITLFNPEDGEVERLQQQYPGYTVREARWHDWPDTGVPIEIDPKWVESPMQTDPKFLVEAVASFRDQSAYISIPLAYSNMKFTATKRPVSVPTRD